VLVTVSLRRKPGALRHHGIIAVIAGRALRVLRHCGGSDSESRRARAQGLVLLVG
jgi:hypothetical protein